MVRFRTRQVLIGRHRLEEVSVDGAGYVIAKVIAEPNLPAIVAALQVAVDMRAAIAAANGR